MDNIKVTITNKNSKQYNKQGFIVGYVTETEGGGDHGTLDIWSSVLAIVCIKHELIQVYLEDLRVKEVKKND